MLLLRNESKFSTTPKDIDFAEFRTLDAVELPGAVNSFCKCHLSDNFIKSYNLIRSLRNQIAHLGRSNKAFDPDELLHILIFQYLELWAERLWLNDRVKFASQTRASFFYDYKYASPHMHVMNELRRTFSILTKSEFKKLFGHTKSVRRYRCHSCIDEASMRYADFDANDCKTAFLNEEGTSLHCAMCGHIYKVSRAKCDSPECKGNVIGDNADRYAGMCHTCGEPQETIVPT